MIGKRKVTSRLVSFVLLLFVFSSCTSLKSTTRKVLIPVSYRIQDCAFCGMDHLHKSWWGITYVDRVQQTDLSQWYEAKKLKKHEHEWKNRTSFIHGWCGDRFHALPIRYLRDAELYVDQAQFQELCEEFYEAVSDPKKADAFEAKCESITRSVSATH